MTLLETHIDALYGRDEAQVLGALQAIQELWDDASSTEREALERACARSVDRLTPGSGRTLLRGLDEPRPALVRWLCACAAGPHLTAVTPGFQLALERWGASSSAIREALIPLLDDEEPGLRGSAQQGVWTLARHRSFGLAEGDDRIVAALWRGVGRGDYRAGAIVAVHALRFEPSRLAELLSAPGRAATGAVSTLDRDRVQATPHLASLEDSLRAVEKKGEKAAREGSTRLLARTWLVGGVLRELERRLAKGGKRDQTAVGLRYAAEDGLRLGPVIPMLADLLTGASGPFLRWTAAEALASAVRTGELADGPGWAALMSCRADADGRVATACRVTDAAR
ncbi:MAG: hypothetical protein H6738_02555 [Alphaproteobacteria bacterium]|nr:hypothetical protein [Alphaproteobacteria bacterium]MCB9695650.1 hypothetical protein [Alphaproteobacteria bacterium]